MNAHRVVKVNDKGARIGEDHPRAKLTDHDVDLILALLDARKQRVQACEAAGMTRGEIRATLAGAQLTYDAIAAKFEVRKMQVYRIAMGLQRGQSCARFKPVGGA